MGEIGLYDLVLHTLSPALYYDFPAQVFWLQVDHTTARDGCWGGDLQIIDLEHHRAGFGHLNTLTIVETEHLVVIEHSVHVLDPESVDWTIENDPPLLIGIFCLQIGDCQLHQPWNDTLGPLIR